MVSTRGRSSRGCHAWTGIQPKGVGKGCAGPESFADRSGSWCRNRLRFAVAATLTSLALAGCASNGTAPSASFSMAPNPAHRNQVVTFDASASTPGDRGNNCYAGNVIEHYDWDLDGSGAYAVHGMIVTRAYQTAGPVVVSLRVTNTCGLTNSQNQPLTVSQTSVPVNKTPPSISGTPRDRELLTASSGTWESTSPLTYGYQWSRCDAFGNGCVDVPNATTPIYSLTPSDLGSTIRVTVKASDLIGSAKATSDPTGKVAALAPSNTLGPRVAGEAREGRTLTTDNGLWDGTPPLSYSYQWRRCDAAGSTCADIAAATSSSYTLVTADVDHTVRAVVTASNSAGSGQARSAATARVARGGVTPSGPLFDHRNQASDHRDEGLYGPDYPLHIDASTSAPSGVKSVDIQVDGVRKDYAEQLCPLGGCTMARDWTFRSDDYSDADHTVAVNVTDQVGGVTTQSWVVSVDRRGDIYHATQSDGDPSASGTVINNEWARSGLTTSRTEEPDYLATRGPVACDPGSSASTCEEIRMRSHSTDSTPNTYDSYTHYKGRSGDPNLRYLAEILKAAQFKDRPVSEQGSLHDLAAPWQRLPPVHGTTYAVYQSTDTRQNQSGPDPSTLPDGSDPADSQTSQTETVTVKLYVDSTTKFPVKQDTVSATGQILDSTYWSYDVGRLEQTQVAGDFFSAAPPAQVAKGTDASLRGNDPLGPQTDQETRLPFTPYYLGPAPTIPGVGAYCLASGDVVNFTSNAGFGRTVDPAQQDPELPAATPAPTVTTMVAANYLTLGSSSLCTPGTGDVPQPDLDISSYARSSTEASDLRASFMQEAQGTQLDMTGSDSVFLRAGMTPISINQQSTTAYSVARPDGTSSALIDVGDATIIVTGPFTKLTLPGIVAQLQPR